MTKQDTSNYSTNLSGHLLVATPQMTDPRFKKSAILICQHDQNSAMGLVINQPKQKRTPYINTYPIILYGKKTQ